MIFDQLGFPSQLLVPWEVNLLCFLWFALCFLMMTIALMFGVVIIVVIEVTMNIWQNFSTCGLLG